MVVNLRNFLGAPAAPSTQLGPTRADYIKQLGLAVLGAGVTSRHRVGERLVAGLQGADQTWQQRNEAAAKRQLAEQELAVRLASLAQKSRGPTSVQEYQFAVQNGYKGSYEQWMAEAGAQGGAEKYSMTGVWGTSPDGKPVMLQLSNRGGIKPVEAPEGVTLQRGQISKIDLGDRFGILDATGSLIGYQMKGIPGSQSVDKEGNRIVLPPIPGGGAPGGAAAPADALPGFGAPEDQLRQATPPAAVPGAPGGMPAGPTRTELPRTPEEALAREKQRAAAAEGAAQSVDTMMDELANARAALEADGAPASGTMSRPFALMSNTNAGRLRSHIKALQSGVALEAMLRLKEASATGATGFGALSERELDVLINSIGALDPDSTDPDILLKTLGRIETRYKRMVDRLVSTVPPEKIKEWGLEPLIAGRGMGGQPGQGDGGGDDLKRLREKYGLED